MNKISEKERILKLIGFHARCIRKSKKYTQRDVAEKLKVSHALISLFERGETDSAYLLYFYENKL